MQNSTINYEILDYEMVHLADDNLFIAHKANKITYIDHGERQIISIPDEGLGWKKIFMPLRKSRRLLRLDKAMITPTSYGFVMCRFGNVYAYDISNKTWTKVDIQLNCRNPIYNALLNCESGIYIGEYGNKNGIGKKVFRSMDEGKTWSCIFQFDPDAIRHIHCLAWDPFERKIWVFTGDDDENCRVLKASPDFSEVEEIGSGSQKWRACHVIFTKDTVEWFMDCPLEEVRYIKYHRQTGNLEIGQEVAGPVWFAREYQDFALAASAQEIGPSHKDKLLHLYRSTDHTHWDEIATFRHDGWPKSYFRFGTMTFARGNKVMISCEGVKGLDGKTIRLK